MVLTAIFWNVVCGFVLLFAIQFTTFHTIAHRQLERELLGEWYQRLAHNYDSAYVEDFVVVDCPVGETNVYKSHNLKKDESKLCGLLKVNRIRFSDRETFRWNDQTRYDYDLKYYTHNTYLDPKFYLDWRRTLGMFLTRQDEIVHMGRVQHGRQATYLWLLFTWVEISEDVYSTGPEDRKAMLVKRGRFEDIRQ